MFEALKWYLVPGGRKAARAALREAARILQQPALAQRATEMARWEAEIQLESGAVRGGTIADAPSPAAFNTGQVLFGWIAAFEATGDERFRDAAARAARWLVE